MKRILLINTVHTSYNGITSVIMNYVRRTYEVVKYDFVLCGEVEQSFADELQTLGGSIFIPPCSRVKKPFTYSAWLKSIMKKNHYDVVHVHGNSGTMYFEIHAAKSSKIPVRIAHSHSSSCKFLLAHYVLKPFLNNNMTHGLACSDMAGKWVFDYEYTVLPNGIDVDEFAFSQETRDKYRKQLGLENKFVIGHVGYMDTEKNHIFLLRVFENFIKMHPEACLLLIGDGKLRPEIERFISTHSLQDNVYLLGKRNDVSQLYQCMDVFVLPSIFEGLPVSLLEAQTAGLDCIVSERVTKEVNLTGKLQYIDITDDAIVKWEESLNEIRFDENARKNIKHQMEDSEYNIMNSKRKLLTLYGFDDKLSAYE